MTRTMITAAPERISAVTTLVGRAVGARPEAVAAMLSFEGRDDYLGFVAAWKAVYAAEAADVRTQKRTMRAADVSDDARGNAQSRRESLRARLRAAIALRLAGKDIARASRAPRSQAA